MKSMAQVFSCEFCEISKNTIFTEHLWTTASAFPSCVWFLREKSKVAILCLAKNVILNFLRIQIKQSIIKTSPTDNYMFKDNDRNTRTRCEICSNVTIKTPERRHWHCSGVFIVNFEHISHFVLEFLLLTLSK